MEFLDWLERKDRCLEILRKTEMKQETLETPISEKKKTAQEEEENHGEMHQSIDPLSNSITGQSGVKRDPSTSKNPAYHSTPLESTRQIEMFSSLLHNLEQGFALSETTSKVRSNSKGTN